MRRSVLVLLLFVSACAAPQQEAPRPTPVSPPSPAAAPLIGLTAADLIGRFGGPALQVPEGNSLKLQFRGASCILDAYLYPSTGGVQRVTYVETRLSTGAPTDQAACISALAARS